LDALDALGSAACPVGAYRPPFSTGFPQIGWDPECQDGDQRLRGSRSTSVVGPATVCARGWVGSPRAFSVEPDPRRTVTLGRPYGPSRMRHKESFLCSARRRVALPTRQSARPTGKQAIEVSS
jgi:hypothetical protein